VLVAIASAKGSPGTTTTARVLASVWPAAVVLADCDPAGGDLAIVGRAHGGGVLNPDRGLLSMAVEARHGLPPGAVAEHVQDLEGGLPVLCGVSSPEQVAAIGPVWPAIATAFASAPGTDVVADCGRVTAGTPLMPVLNAADVVLFVVRPRVEQYAHLRERLRWLAAAQRDLQRAPRTAVVLVGDKRTTDSSRDLKQLLAHDGLAVPVVGPLAHDQQAADALAARIDRGIGRSLLVRSARLLVDPVRALAAGRQHAPAGTGR
jgi:MinD-like ATPase involved in chromosome partitioning or flagellar assembly